MAAHITFRNFGRKCIAKRQATAKLLPPMKLRKSKILPPDWPQPISIRFVFILFFLYFSPFFLSGLPPLSRNSNGGAREDEERRSG
ncbi:hypothetical protein TNCV_5010181 [Trichonephila clavipes]|nr:hypothetical protein TNCV_5010181 [Trichonephila clavipes]